MSTTTALTSNQDLAALSLPELEAEITTLYGHINAATYRLLVLIHAFNERDGWGEWGIKSCAHWLNWKCGIALGAAREKVRAAEALPSLPLISEAFRKGEISYSKVRAMTRVATPENEDYLVMIARHGTASHVEKLVREYRRTQRWAEECRTAETRHQLRMVEHYYDEDGLMVIRAKLPPEQGAVVLEALNAAVETIADEVREQKRQADERERADSEREEEAAAQEARNRNEHAEDSPLDNPELSTESVPAGTLSGRRDGAGTPAFAERVHGLRPDETRPQRRADALLRMAETVLATGIHPSSGGDRYQVVIHVDAVTLHHRHTTDPGQCTLDEGPWLAAETARRIGCNASIVALTEDPDGHPLNVGRKTRSIPPAMRRALKARDKGCRFPGCTQSRFVDGHHVHHWADGGETKLGNLVQLYRYHHRLVHEGGFNVNASPDGDFRFSRPDGELIESRPCAPCVHADSGEELTTMNEENGLDITSETAVTLWDGVQMDYDMAIGGLSQLAPQTQHDGLVANDSTV